MPPTNQSVVLGVDVYVRVTCNVDVSWCGVQGRRCPRPAAVAGCNTFEWGEYFVKNLKVLQP